MSIGTLARTAATVALTAGLLAGCGGSGGSGGSSAEEETAKKNIQASLQKDAVAGSSLTDKQAACLADALVDDVGVDKLQEYELLDAKLKVNEDLSKTKMEAADADAAAAAFTGCVDVVDAAQKQLAAVAPNMNEKQKACVADVFSEERIQKTLSLTFQGKDDQIGSDLRQDLTKCVTP